MAESTDAALNPPTVPPDASGQLEVLRLPPINVQSLSNRADGFDERLKELETAFESQNDALKGATHPGHSAATMKVAGRIHLDHWGFPGDSPGVNAFETGDPTSDPQDRFAFRRMRIGVRGDILDNMEYRVVLELAGGDDSQYRDVWIGFKHLPILQKLLIGNQKRPYGLDHLNSSRYNVFVGRPLVVEAINQDSRRLGAVSYGVSEDESLNWRYGIYNLRLIQDESGHINDHYQPELAGRLANTFWYDEASDGRGYGHVAIAGSLAWPDGSARNDGIDDNEARFRTRPEARSSNRWLDTGTIAGADAYQLVAAEAVFNAGPVQFVSEYQNIFMQRDPGTGRELHFHGGYAYISYFLTGEHMPWDRRTGILGRIKPFENFFLVDRCCGGIGSGWGAWQVAARWSYLDLTDQDVTGGVGQSVTLGLNWYWNAYARMQFNAIYGNIDQRGPVAGQTHGDYTIVGTRLSVDF